MDYKEDVMEMNEQMTELYLRQFKKEYDQADELRSLAVENVQLQAELVRNAAIELREAISPTREKVTVREHDLNVFIRKATMVSRLAVFFNTLLDLHRDILPPTVLKPG